MSKPSFTSAECPECGAYFGRVELDFDEDSGHGYAALEVKPCAECGRLLCVDCAQFACEACGHTFCREHAVVVAEGTECPFLCCAPCALECEEIEPIPVQSELAFAAGSSVEVA